MHEEDGLTRLFEKMLRASAKEQFARARAAVSPEHHQVGRALARGGDEPLGGRTSASVEAADVGVDAMPGEYPPT